MEGEVRDSRRLQAVIAVRPECNYMTGIEVQGGACRQDHYSTRRMIASRYSANGLCSSSIGSPSGTLVSVLLSWNASSGEGSCTVSTSLLSLSSATTRDALARQISPGSEPMR